ncbi:hypothetical protein RIB2604_01002520 [Aspergillus luchuensis]|uniref:Uncharacterized protein n=1 Tax=Aspergillus kawachii TaxID=1069201 RepID=A0A146F6M0_ASPKA|nr:hypothetical protein RIB2604_01002520 [Aspergillus luchuensis]
MAALALIQLLLQEHEEYLHHAFNDPFSGRRHLSPRQHRHSPLLDSFPKGNGFFLIYSADNDQDAIGCLANNGKWTTAEVTACGIPHSDGEGYVEGFDGYLRMNANRVITTAKD